MELRIVLCCLFGVITAAPSSPTTPQPPQPYDTIVVGLGSAGVTAATTLARAGRRVLGLEAQNRTGGRVHTVPFGDGVVELGAEWIHGTNHSRVYDLAVANNITTKFDRMEMPMFTSDGSKTDSDLILELSLICYTTYKQDNGTAQPPEPIGTRVTRRVKNYIADMRPELLQNQDFITEFLEYMNLLIDTYEASNDWNDVTTNSRFEELGGSEVASWHRYGYKTFFEIMLNKYNNGPGLSNLDIKLNTEVTQIKVPQHPGEKAVVTCKDGTTYEAENVIVTVSLGVLKATHSSLFTPPLPKEKQTAIDKISMGLMDKVILAFDEIWWPQNTSYLGLMWKGEDKKKVPKEDYWTTRISGVSMPMGSSNTLTLWATGDIAKKVESLPEDVVQNKSVALLQRFIGDTLKITVPQPKAIVRSFWHTNPFTRGSYTYDNVLTPQYPDTRAWLGAPLTDSAGAPRVLFAGEATNLRHFGTVHGASETGYREAKRLVPSV